MPSSIYRWGRGDKGRHRVRWVEPSSRRPLRLQTRPHRALPGRQICPSAACRHALDEEKLLCEYAPAGRAAQLTTLRHGEETLGGPRGRLRSLHTAARRRSFKRLTLARCLHRAAPCPEETGAYHLKIRGACTTATSRLWLVFLCAKLLSRSPTLLLLGAPSLDEKIIS